jgi:hypothetical protein
MRDVSKLLTLRQAEEMTGRRVSTWRRDILRRRVSYVKIGRQIRIPLEVINDLVRSGYRPAVNSSGPDEKK